MDMPAPASQMTTAVLPPRWVMWVAALLVIALVALVAFQPDLRALAASTWREMISISPYLLAVLFFFRVVQALFSALVWRNMLRAAWPETAIPYRFVLAVDQGQDVVNTLVPMRGGTWAMLGIFDLSIPRARPPKLLAVWGVQNLAFLLFAGVTYVITAVALPGQTQRPGDLRDSITSRPLVALGAAIAAVCLVVLLGAFGRRKLIGIRQQVREGIAILKTPRRYLRLVFLPSLASHVAKIVTYGILLSAFGIPVSVLTLALALGSHALAGAVRITPAGLGTTQALDVVALQAYAPAEVVTAYSLSVIAITAIGSLAVTVVALVSSVGRRRLQRLFRLFRRGELSEALQRVSRLQRITHARRARRGRP
jgi:uncharacterized membrane protein YbhN (UPF0104 family)